MGREKKPNEVRRLFQGRRGMRGGRKEFDGDHRFSSLLPYFVPFPFNTGRGRKKKERGGTEKVAVTFFSGEGEKKKKKKKGSTRMSSARKAVVSLVPFPAPLFPLPFRKGEEKKKNGRERLAVRRSLQRKEEKKEGRRVLEGPGPVGFWSG